VTEYQQQSQLERNFKAVRSDLLRDGGAQISTTRNYNFAIVPYLPEEEFACRAQVNRLSAELRDAGWTTATIALHALLLQRLRASGNEYVAALVAREKRLYPRDPERALNHLREKIVHEIEGPEGLAADVVREIKKLLEEVDSAQRSRDRTVVFIARAGALYPFFRTSALLKHLADYTENIPVILLYPGKVVGEAGRGDIGLSFMGKLPADRDYRPRIYHQV
jgi:hypothetical protein